MATSNDTEIRPDHFIIWLDKNMGISQNNQTSKNELASNANLDCVPSTERIHDIDNFICRIDPTMINEQTNNIIKNILRMFTDEDECLKFIDDNLKEKKELFLITSGQMGASIVPKIHKKLSGRIYIFCAQRYLHEIWTGPYENDIEIYDDETGVFARVLADIGIYYYLKGSDTSLNSIQYFCWARRLIKRASKLDRINRDEYLKYIADELVALRADQTDGTGQNPDED